MKSGFLNKLLLFTFLSLLLFALLAGIMFSYTSQNVFMGIKARDLIPRAVFISAIVSQYQRGEISALTLESILNSDMMLWDATVHIIASNGMLIANTGGEAGAEALNLLVPYLPQVLSDSTGILVANSKELGIIVAAAVYGVDASVLGAVFLTKPLYEVKAALSGLNSALIVSLIGVFMVMLLPAYLGSRGITRPLLQMSLAAKAMAKGDFSIRANERRTDELGQLGNSLNELAEELSKTIGDLTLERNRLRNILDGLKEGVVAVDNAGAITHFNKAAENILAIPGESLLERLNELWPDTLQDAAMQKDDIAANSRVVAFGQEQLQITKTGILGREGEPAGAVATIRNITEEMRLEQTRRDYVANVSHELRTPTASIRSLAEALNDGLVKEEEDSQRYYSYILRESIRLSRLIDDLLELSRLQSGAVALKKYNVDLKPLLDGLAERFELAATESGLEFSYSPELSKLKAYTNKDRVEQILIILLDNAIKYAVDGGLVRLAAEDNPEGLMLSVCSTGEIQVEHLPHLFERFYKADNAHAEQGIGLGLAIAKEIAVLLGERIWAENCSGEACFRFMLRHYSYTVQNS